jgi:hypothetical protein
MAVSDAMNQEMMLVPALDDLLKRLTPARLASGA